VTICDQFWWKGQLWHCTLVLLSLMQSCFSVQKQPFPAHTLSLKTQRVLSVVRFMWRFTAVVCPSCTVLLCFLSHQIEWCSILLTQTSLSLTKNSVRGVKWIIWKCANFHATVLWENDAPGFSRKISDMLQHRKRCAYVFSKGRFWRHYLSDVRHVSCHSRANVFSRISRGFGRISKEKTKERREMEWR